MGVINVAAYDTTDYRGSEIPAYAVWSANREFRSGGVTIGKSKPGDPERGLKFACSQIGEITRIAAGILYSTVDSSKPNASGKLSFYDQYDNLIYIFANKHIRVPATTPTTWDAIFTYSDNPPTPTPMDWLDIVNGLIASAIAFLRTLPATVFGSNTYTGAPITGLVNSGGVSQWDAVYLNGASQWAKASANGVGTYPARGLATATKADLVATDVIADALVRNDAWTWTPGAPIYLADVAGGLTQVQPSTLGDKLQVVGFAISATVAKFDFNSTFTEIE